MASTPAPQLPLLPPAPQRSMGSVTYPVVADAWSAAIGPWTVKLNDIVVYFNGLSVDATAAVQASATAVAAKNEAQAYSASAKASAIAAENAQGSLGNLALMYAIALSA